MSDLFEFDELSLYFGAPYTINEYITITLPNIGDVVAFGEKAYYSMIQTLTAIPSDMKSVLWDSGLDWCEVDDFQLFMMLCQSMPKSKTSIILGDVDLQSMRPFENKQNGEIVLYDQQSGAIIDELAYKKICSYLCKAHNITKKVERAINEFTKKILIDEDRQRIATSQSQPYKSFLMPLITAVKCRQGYTLDYVKQMGLYEFFTDLSRLNIIVSTDALLSGMYSGFCDTSKIPRSQFDWCREIDNN